MMLPFFWLLVTNCGINSRFYYMFSQFCHDNQLICSDYAHLTDAVTCCSDDGLRQSWVDHIVCSAPVDGLVYSLTVADDIVSSDHKPVSVVLSDLIPRNKTCLQFTYTNYRPEWSTGLKQITYILTGTNSGLMSISDVYICLNIWFAVIVITVMIIYTMIC